MTFMFFVIYCGSLVDLQGHFPSRLLALSIGQRLCVNFYVSGANFLTTLRSHLDVTCSYYFWSSLLALSLGQRLCIKLSDSSANFLTTLCSHLDLSGSFRSSLLALSVG
jgi:hypothetical protein